MSIYPTSAELAARPARLRRWWAGLSSRRLRRLNHVLIPEKKPDRDRLRRSRLGRVFGFLLGIVQAHSREGRALLLLAVPVGCAGIDVRFTQTHQLFTMLVGLLLAALLLRPMFRVTGLRATVRAPHRVAVGASVRLDVRLCNEGSTVLTSLRVEPPFLPWDGEWLCRPRGVPVLEPGARAVVTAEAAFAARGEHHLDPFEIGRLVPFGLTVGPRRATVGARFLVVPQVANVSSVQTEHRLPEWRGAMAASLQPGETDIAGVRPYRPGDALKHLHARTWARTGVPYVRQYFDERHDRACLAVLVDGVEASERAKEATISLAAGAASRLALHEGGLDMLLIDDEPFPILPRCGARALDAVLDRLAVHELTDAERAAQAALRERLAEMSSLVVISAEVTQRARDVVDAARARGVPARWTIVTDSSLDLHAVPATAAMVEAEAVEAGRPVTL
jgi:uncharacterized protein (DUF58 family)